MIKRYLSTSDDIYYASIIKPYGSKGINQELYSIDMAFTHFFKLEKWELMFSELFVKQMVYSQNSIPLESLQMFYGIPVLKLKLLISTQLGMSVARNTSVEALIISVQQLLHPGQ